MNWPRPRWPDITAPAPGKQPSPLRVRLAWMAAIWGASSLALLALAGGLRLVLSA